VNVNFLPLADLHDPSAALRLHRFRNCIQLRFSWPWHRGESLHDVFQREDLHNVCIEILCYMKIENPSRTLLITDLSAIYHTYPPTRTLCLDHSVLSKHTRK
jgi:hypothetical protein